MSVVDGSKPDLIFYYSLALDSTRIFLNIQNNDINQTASGILFADAEFLIPIGNFAFNVTIFNALEKDQRKLFYEVTGTNVYFLPEGTISNSINIQFVKNSLGKFIVPPGTINTYQILSGSGDFLNQRGVIVQITNEIVGREMQVYFNK
jgi:hypothetical protein